MTLLLNSVGLRVAVCRSAADLRRRYQAGEPACLLWGLPLPHAAQFDLPRQLREWRIDAPLILIAARADVALAVTALKQGVVDVLEKPLNEQQLLDDVYHTLRHEAARLQAQHQNQELRRRFALLTSREQEVLHGILAGRANREVAAMLNLSCKTVEIHRAKIMQKTQARHLAQLIHMALALGILPLWDEETPAADGTEPVTVGSVGSVGSVGLRCCLSTPISCAFSRD